MNLFELYSQVMTKRAFSAILAAFLLVGVVPQVSAATAKAGATCSKLKATSVVKGKKFTCIKSGKKLVWDKGIIVKPVLSAAEVARNARATAVQKAFDEIASIAKTTTIKPTDIVSISSPEITPASKAAIEKRYSFVASFFDNELSAKSSVSLILGTNAEVEWVGNQLSALSGNSFDKWLDNFGAPSKGAPCGPFYSAGSNGFTKEGRILNNYNLFGKNCATQLPSDENFQTTVEHEWVHNVQKAISFNDSENKNALGRKMPCWFIEGQAVFYGSTLGYRDNYDGYLKVRKWNMKNGVYRNPQTRTDISQTLAKLGLNYDGFACGVDGGYSIGSIAVEKMVLLKGHAGVIAFMKELKNQVDWQQAFEVVYGIDGDVWLTKVGKDIALDYSDAGLSILPPALEVTPTCPSPSNSDQNGITRNRANALVGMDEANAEQCAASLNWGYRVGQRDEEFYATTKDYRLDRVTVVIMSGLVTRVDVG